MRLDIRIYFWRRNKFCIVSHL